jgi:hypothetical protein
MSLRSLLVSFSLFVVPLPVPAQHTETREFEITANGSPAGMSRMQVVQEKNGDATMTGSVDVKFRPILFITHTFASRTQEVWKNGKLAALTGDSTENSTRTVVNAKADANGLTVTTNGVPQAVAGPVWSSSFWKLPSPNMQQVTQIKIVEPDTGKVYDGKLEFQGQKMLQVNNNQMQCLHFKLTGIPCETELWFDQFHRLVRQEFTEQRQHMVVQLRSRK